MDDSDDNDDNRIDADDAGDSVIKRLDKSDPELDKYNFDKYDDEDGTGFAALVASRV